MRARAYIDWQTGIIYLHTDSYCSSFEIAEFADPSSAALSTTVLTSFDTWGSDRRLRIRKFIGGLSPDIPKLKNFSFRS